MSPKYGCNNLYYHHFNLNGGNRDYCNPISVTFETTRKFLIVFVRLVLGKVQVDGFTGP